MLKKHLTGFVLILFILSLSVAVFAQDDKKPAKKGPEKIMIYDGDQFKLQLYGFVKLEAVYNTTNVANEHAPLFVINDNSFLNSTGTAVVTPTDNQINYLHVKNVPAVRDGSLVFDARTSRLGLKLTGPTALKAKTSAVIEADFWGDHASSGTAARQGQVRMRHAFGKLEWDFGMYKPYLLVGQYWSIAMPIHALANTANFLPFGFSGLIFMREPQAILGQQIGTKTFNVVVEAAVSRVQAGNDAAGNLYPGVNGVQLDDRGAGEASKLPGYRGRVVINVNPMKMMQMTFGITGHYQFEKHQLSLTRIAAYTGATVTGFQLARTVNSFHYGAYGKIKISLFTVLGAWFNGWNMDTFLCGLGEGTVENMAGTKLLPVHTMGGYVQGIVDLRTFSIPISIAGGFGQETKYNSPHINAGRILWNKQISGNIMFYMNNYLSFGLEIANFQTKYKRVFGVAENMKYHGFMLFKF